MKSEMKGETSVNADSATQKPSSYHGSSRVGWRLRLHCGGIIVQNENAYIVSREHNSIQKTMNALQPELTF